MLQLKEHLKSLVYSAKLGLMSSAIIPALIGKSVCCVPLGLKKVYRKKGIGDLLNEKC